MKKWRIIILLVGLLCACSEVRSVSMYSTARPYQQTGFYTTSPYINQNRAYNNNYAPQQISTYRIGYTTIGYGKQTMQSMSTYRPYHVNNYYGSTYSPNRPGPRKITVYNGEGDTADTPGGNNDSSDWLYMQDGEGNWYCSKDGGITWYRWEEKDYSGTWGWLSYLLDLATGNTEAWSTTPTTPPEDSGHWASDPDDPFLTPIDNKGMLLFLSILALVYGIIRKRTTNESRRLGTSLQN